MPHHAGLPGDRIHEFAAFEDLAPGYDEAFMGLPALMRDEYLASRPGQIFSYSSLGYSLVGAAVASASGRSFVG